MKISKDAQRIARQLMKATVEDGRVNDEVVRTIVSKLKKDQPRGFEGVLAAYHRLLRLELERSHAVVESATKLEPGTRDAVEADLQKKHGKNLNIEFKENPELLGGLRVRVGSDVWDGSVNGRLERLKARIG